MKRIIPCILGLLLLCSCSDLIAKGEAVLVVEGWIDSGSYPMVQVTQNMPVPTTPVAMSDLAEYVIFFARVRVTEGHIDEAGQFVAESEPQTLAGRKDDRYLVPFIYTSIGVKGVPGKSYKLTVDYSNRHTEAVATIPEPVAIDSLTVAPYEGSDTLFTIDAHLTEPKDRHCCYKSFVKVDGEGKAYESTFLGTADGSSCADGHVIMHVNRPVSLNTDDYEPYFHAGTTVHVKVGTVQQQVYRYWNDFDDASAFIRSPLFPVTANIAGNLSDGAIGIWAGYGVSEASVSL